MKKHSVRHLPWWTAACVGLVTLGDLKQAIIAALIEQPRSRT
jgi:hypothetical protein